MTTLLLSRHGQTLWNSELRYQGQLDTDLSELGLAQAERLASRLSRETVTAIYSSDLKRCSDTADVVATKLALPVERTPFLREASYGSWQGMTYAEVRAQYPELVAQRHRDIVNFAPPEGESLGQTYSRVAKFLEEIAGRHDSQTILVMTHGGPLRMLVASLLGMPLLAAFRLRMDNCSLTVCEGFPHRPDVVTVNDTCHLRGLVSADPALGN